MRCIRAVNNDAWHAVRKLSKLPTSCHYAFLACDKGNGTERLQRNDRESN